MSANPSASTSAICGHDRVCGVVQGLLRAAQASGWTDDTLSAASGVPARTIKSYRVEGKEPSLSNALSIACVLGARAINGVLSIIGYGGAKPLDEADEVNPNLIIASLLPHVSTIALAAADGRIDHIEKPGCTTAADQIIATVMPLSSAGAAE